MANLSEELCAFLACIGIHISASDMHAHIVSYFVAALLLGFCEKLSRILDLHF